MKTAATVGNDNGGVKHRVSILCAVWRFVPASGRLASRYLTPITRMGHAAQPPDGGNTLADL